MSEFSLTTQRDRSLASAIKIALQPKTLLSSALVSVTMWLTIILLAVTFSLLIFQGRLAGFYGVGVGIILVSAIVGQMVTVFFSSDHTLVSCPQDASMIVQATMVGGLLAAAPAELSEESLLVTAVAAMALSSILTGLCLLLIGVGRIGEIIRYIPYPVVGGFLAGVGWQLVQGAFHVMVDLPLSLPALPALLDGMVITRWLPALLGALILIWLLRRSKNIMLIPAATIGALVLFYGLLFLSGEDVNSLSEQGWLLSGFADSAFGVSSPLLDTNRIAQIDFRLALARPGDIFTLIVITIFGFFMNISSQMLMLQREFDASRESTVAGAGNIIASFVGGGAICYPSITAPALMKHLGGYGRLIGLALIPLLVLSLHFGEQIVALFPRIILGGLLIYLGVSFLIEWVYDSWFKLAKSDYFIIIIIMLVIDFFGFLPGIIVGVSMAIVHVILEYNRIGSIKQELSGAVYRSSIERSHAENRLLKELGHQIWALRLHGFIFFGTAYQFYERVKARVLDQSRQPLAFLILDFRLVHGIDISTAVDFNKLRQLTRAHGIQLLLSNVSPHVASALAASAAEQGEAAGALPLGDTFDDLDHALEWCENELLSSANLDNIARVSLAEQFNNHAMIPQFDLGALRGYLEPVEAEPGDFLAHQGSDSDVLYFIESGQVDILLHVESDRVIRLRSMSAGAIVGEVGFYLRRPRTASIVVTEAGVFYKLSQAALQRMEQDDPQAAMAFHVFTSCVLADRLTVTNGMVQALSD